MPSPSRRPTAARSATGTSSRQSPTTSRSGLHQLLGHIEAGWGHVHFAESIKGRYLDPIRPGAIQPFIDVGHPTIAQIMFRRGKTDLKPDRIKGRVQICCVAYDTTPIHVPRRGRTCPSRPPRLRYRIVLRRPLRPAAARRQSTCACSASPMSSMPSTPGHAPEPPQQARALHLHPRPRLEQRGVRERRLPARGAGRRRARQPRDLGARRSRSATERRSGARASGSTTTCSRWNAPIGLSLRPCTFGRRSTSWREYESGTSAARWPIQTRSNSRYRRRRSSRSREARALREHRVGLLVAEERHAELEQAEVEAVRVRVVGVPAGEPRVRLAPRRRTTSPWSRSARARRSPRAARRARRWRPRAGVDAQLRQALAAGVAGLGEQLARALEVVRRGPRRRRGPA